MTDPVSDMLIRIKNASAVKKDTVIVPYSKIKMAIAKTLEKEGYIKKAEHKGKKTKKFIEIILDYDENKNPKVFGMRRISKPSVRIYSEWKRLAPYTRKKGIVILTTSKGLLTAFEAKNQKIGGEILCHIW